jgi:hypothetical protein
MGCRVKPGNDEFIWTSRIEGRLRQNEGALFPAIAELLGFPDRRGSQESLIPLVRLPEFCHFEDE